MITLFPFSLPGAPYRPGRIPRYAQRDKDTDLAQMTTKQIKAEAQRVLTAGLSPQTLRAIDLLATGGVFSGSHLGMAERTLRRLAQWRLLDRVKINPDEIAEKYKGPEFSFLGPSLYTLGPIGIEIATQRHGVLPPTGYQIYLPTRVIHDLISNEIVLRLAQAIGERGWKVEWLGKYEGTLREANQERTLVEPDALIRFRRDGQERAFLLEYHHEEKSSRAEDKVRRYEMAAANENWRKTWEVETFPPILAVCLHPIVSTGYINAIEGRRTRCTYYGKMLKSILDGNFSNWVNISTNQREDILPAA